MSPEHFDTLALAWLAGLTLLIAPSAGLILLVMKNARDIRAAWRKLGEHEAALNGKLSPPEGRGGGHEPNAVDIGSPGA